MKVYGIATADVNKKKRKSRKAAQLIVRQEGFVGLYPNRSGGVLWLFDTRRNAEEAKKVCIENGIVCGGSVIKGYTD